jgi:hypothetical protein
VEVRVAMIIELSKDGPQKKSWDIS